MKRPRIGYDTGAMRVVGIVGFALAVAVSSSPARADEASRARADALFREGRAAAQAGDHATACAKFAESQRVEASTGTVFNLGDCSEHLGKWVAARAYFRDAIVQLDPGDRRAAPAKERLRALEGRMPRLTVSIDGGAGGGTVRCDGAVLAQGEVGQPRLVDPGEHRCVFSTPGHADAARTVTVREGGAEQIAIGAGPLVEAAPRVDAPARRAPPPPSGPPTLGLVAGGIGLAGLAVATVSGLVLLNEKSRADAGCHDKIDCNDDARRAIDANKTWVTVNTAAWIVGAAGIGVGAYAFLTRPSAAKASGSVPARRPVAILAAAPLPGGAGASATVILP